jgi:hypothetical protein
VESYAEEWIPNRADKDDTSRVGAQAPKDPMESDDPKWRLVQPDIGDTDSVRAVAPVYPVDSITK